MGGAQSSFQKWKWMEEWLQQGWAKTAKLVLAECDTHTHTHTFKTAQQGCDKVSIQRNKQQNYAVQTIIWSLRGFKNELK